MSRPTETDTTFTGTRRLSEVLRTPTFWLAPIIVYIVLALPSSGGTLPLEASPVWFGHLAGFEPMRQIFLGTRALLYLDGRQDAGLSRALTMTGIGLTIGLALGISSTLLYDRRGMRRA